MAFRPKPRSSSIKLVGLFLCCAASIAALFVFWVGATNKSVLHHQSAIAKLLEGSTSQSRCATSVVASLPGSSAAIGNPSTRDRWIQRAAENTPPGADILDVSAGARPYRALWSHCNYKSHEFNGNVGVVDVVRGEDANTVKKLDAVHNYIGDYTATGAPSDAFDVVLLTEVLEHLPQPMLAFAELTRVAKPGGNIYITAPFTSGSHQQPYHFSSGYSREFYEHAAKVNGLEVVSIESQGDYFKLMAQEVTRVLQCATIDAGVETEVEEIRAATVSYLLKLSAMHGDGVELKQKAWCADLFTLGFMAHLRKPLKV